MKAAFIQQYGNHSELKVGERPNPTPNANQVLIKVVASGVNPVDFHLRNGMMADSGTHTLPLILGWDCSGIIEQVGEQVQGFNQGDKVLSFTPIAQQGTNAEFVVVDANLINKKPDTMTFIDAAALPLASVTAYQGLHKHGKIKAGQKVLIHNASGAVGAFAVQIAKAAGAYVVATASQSKQDYVKSLGADECYVEGDNEWANLGYFNLAFVAKPGATLLERTVRTVQSGGRVISTFDEIPDAQTSMHGIAFTRMWVENSKDDLDEVLSLVENNQLFIPVDSVWPLEQIQHAHQRSEQYQALGKIVLIVDPLNKR